MTTQAEKEAIAQIVTPVGGKHLKVDLTAGTTTVHTGKGRVVGYYVNTVPAGDATELTFDSVDTFTVPINSGSPQFIPLGFPEYLVDLKVTPGGSISAGSITIVYQPYP